MKKIYKIIIITLTIFLAFAVILSISYSNKIDQMVKTVKSSIFTSQKPPKYHFAIILHNTDKSYLKEIENGLKDNAKELNVVLETNYVSDENDYNETLKYINIAIYSKVDGIITHVYNTEDFQKLIDIAQENKIPVITLDSDLSKSKGTTFIGTNGFEIGSKAGELVVQASRGSSRVAIILDDPKKVGNTKIEGFNNATENHLDIKIEIVKESDKNNLVANNAIQDILINHPYINTIVCTSSKDTIGAARLVIDSNHVSDITIIGYDSTPEILSYIKKGIIYATIVPGSYKIGSDSVKTLVDLKETGRATSNIQIDSKIITKENVDEYIKASDVKGVE